MTQNDVTSFAPLRTHISETWRLHRRLLRNRRTENTEFLLPGRDGAETCEWHSSRLATFDDLIAEWRLSAAQHFYDTLNLMLLRTVRLLVACWPKSSCVRSRSPSFNCSRTTGWERGSVSPRLFSSRTKRAHCEPHHSSTENENYWDHMRQMSQVTVMTRCDCVG